jgi:hypothetical protein
LDAFPATQGLGSVLGLVALGSRYGIVSDMLETVSWIGGDGVQRSARVPVIYFLKERIDEFA